MIMHRVTGMETADSGQFSLDEMSNARPIVLQSALSSVLSFLEEGKDAPGLFPED